ncbi:MAG: formylglycine-generating enzyme family protein [Bacteroidales bacterium]|jgi:formylglycine-generating enzyme required for sulfatase activity|nr:formylglycine-generating enzyme family protein [Bacteroidales bacterium]
MYKKLFLSLLLLLNVHFLSATNYFVGFNSIPAGNNNIKVLNQGTLLGATLLTVLGEQHSYSPTYGDTVFLAAGKYMLPSEITIPKGVTVLGGYNANAATTVTLTRTYPGSVWPTNSFGAVTVLDGNSFLSLPADKHRVATVYGTLETCYIRNGYSNTNGGGLYVDGGTVTACIMRGNVAMNKTYTAKGGGAYVTNGGKMYHCLITNNMANYGFGAYTDGVSSVVSNSTMVYNTWSPRPVFISGTGGNDGKSITETGTYFSHEVYNALEKAPASKYTGLRIQLSDFYMQQTETTVIQYCCFLAAIDYEISGNDVKISSAGATDFSSLKAFSTSVGTKTIGEYYNFNPAKMSDATLCYGFAVDNNFGYGVRNTVGVNVLYPQEKYGRGTVPYDEMAFCGVSWYGAVAYSHWLGGNLPTEAQWEFALRRTTDTFSGNNDKGVSTGAYPYGNGSITDVGYYGWYKNNSHGHDADGVSSNVSDYGTVAAHLHRVGQKRASPIGLFDMDGNLLEWCADWFNGNLYIYDNDANNNWYSAVSGSGANAVYLDPMYKVPLTDRVHRGGAWYYPVARMRSGFRVNVVPTHRIDNIGFRSAWNSSAAL